jgi:hypothetical protein
MVHEQLVQQVREMLTWPENWNSYNAFPIRPESAAECIAWLQVQPADLPTPNITANATGTVVCEWSRNHKHITIYFEGPLQPEVSSIIRYETKPNDTQLYNYIDEALSIPTWVSVLRWFK